MNKAVILGGVAAAAFLGPFTQTVYAPSLPELQDFFGVDTLLVNLTISLFTAILALSNFVVGPAADRRGRRAVLLPGLVAFVLGSILCLSATSYSFFLAGRAVQAFGISTALLVAPTVVGDIFPPAERAQAMSVYQTVIFLGPVLGPLLGGVIAQQLGWRWSFALLSVAGAGVWFYNLRCLQETKPAVLAAAGHSLRPFVSVLVNRSARSIILVGFSQFYGYYVFLVFLPKLLTALSVFSTAVKGAMFAPLTAGILAGIYVGHQWQKRWSRTRILASSSFLIGSNVLVLWLAVFAGALTVPLLVALLLVYGVLLGCSLPVQSTILVNLFTKDRGTAVGAYNFFRFMGAAIGPIVGALVEAWFGVHAVILSVAVLLGLSAVALRFSL
ncbi:MAG TPA: MFS transporter, partial [Casimicrobiaceae bacterium]|nr:MFS transporter [Casimicrobiaceae bacterium]